MSRNAEDITQGFTRVDQAADTRFFIEFLDARKTIEGEREVKDLILEMLRLEPGVRVLDVGCGTGDDVREMAGFVGRKGQVVGIDRSQALIEESQRRAERSMLPVEFRLGDVCKLDFPHAAFDRIRTDRVLMFVPEIEVALTEMVRVLRPGGRLVASELDHELRFINSRLPEVDGRVHAAWIASNPQPRLGRQLPWLFASHGLFNISSTIRLLRPPFGFLARVNEGFLRAAVTSGQLKRAEVDAWLTDIAQLAKAGLLMNGIVAFTVSGEKPA
jgi:ubiquinone/menaquinone biosynthesis C-methylase UbiE